MNFSLNDMAAQIVEEQILPHAEELNVEVIKLKNGATVIDMGIHAKGGWKAGKLYTDVCLGGMGELVYQSMYIGKHIVPTAVIEVDRPAITQMCAHIAGLYLPYRGYHQPVAGPIRSITSTDHWSDCVAYRDTEAKKAVGCLQITTLPDEELAQKIADAVGKDPSDLYLLASRTSTIVGAVQIIARNIEQAFATIADHPDFPIECIVQAVGYSPIATIEDDEIIAMGRVNDCLIYGAESTLYCDCEDSLIEQMLEKLPLCKNESVYGIPFEEMFREAGCDWAHVPRDYDAPCKVNFINVRTNHFYSAGMIHYGVLERDFMGY